MTNSYRIFFILEVLVIFAVVGIFKLIPERLIAGAVAGSVFVFLGFAILWLSWRRGILKRSFTTYAAALHLFGSALPLMITRLANSAMGFDEVLVLGLPGPVFHKVSNVIYMTLIVATLIDWLLSARALRVAAK